MQARQGDVLLTRCDTTIPTTAAKLDSCVLALGEVTGHAHQIRDGAFLWVDTDVTKYVEVYGVPGLLWRPRYRGY